jgi:pimeloyl-ACP methyl ester carboxylesterase
MRGYSESEKPKEVTSYKMEFLIRDINELVHALGKESCILIGHDWGGAVAWQVAGWVPSIVDKLVILNAPHPTAYAQKLSSSLGQFLKSWYIFFFQIPILPEIAYRTDDLDVLRRLFGSSTNTEELEAYKWVWSQNGALTPPLNYYRNLLDIQNLLQPKVLPRIKMPTLIIWGENDLALEKDLAVMSGSFCEQCKVVLVPGASHFVHHDKPDSVNRAIAEFVKQND